MRWMTTATMGALVLCGPACHDQQPSQGQATESQAGSEAEAPMTRGGWREKPAGAPLLAQAPDFTAVAAQVLPAVVSIQVEQGARTAGHGTLNGARPDPFGIFRGGEVPHEERARDLGSGLVIREDGLIVTNQHVVENATAIQVTFVAADGSQRTLDAKVLGGTPEYDVALLQTTENAHSPIAYLGDSSSTRIGDWVMAIGNPFGLSHSVSVGIVSAKERREVEPSGRRGIYDFIQTDASINPGNSGGPLVNMRGDVIGINAATNVAGQGIGFAIPINMVKQILPQLKEKGRFVRSWLGVKIQPLSPELAETYGHDGLRGALIAEVTPESPASKAGMREGDIVVEFDGHSIAQSNDLVLFASMAGAGKRVTATIWRDGKQNELSLTLEEFPQEPTGTVAPRLRKP